MSDVDLGDAQSPREQLSVITRRFCRGDDFEHPPPHPMNPAKDGVWRIRTPDLRIVGWFPQRSLFIVSEIELKRNCTDLRDNQLMLSAIKLRKKLNIGNGVFLKGGIDDCV